MIEGSENFSENKSERSVALKTSQISQNEDSPKVKKSNITRLTNNKESRIYAGPRYFALKIINKTTINSSK